MNYEPDIKGEEEERKGEGLTSGKRGRGKVINFLLSVLPPSIILFFCAAVSLFYLAK